MLHRLQSYLPCPQESEPLMGIFYNDVNACSIPCKQTVPAPVQNCVEAPVNYCNDRYIYGHCNGSYRFKYMSRMGCCSELRDCDCGDTFKQFSVPFDFLGNRFSVRVSKNDVSFDSGYSAFSIKGMHICNHKMEFTRIRDVRIFHIEGYADCNYVRPEKIKVVWTDETYFSKNRYQLEIRVNPSTRRVVVEVFKNGCSIGKKCSSIYIG